MRPGIFADVFASSQSLSCQDVRGGAVKSRNGHMSGGRSLASRDTHYGFYCPQYRLGLQPQLHPSTPRYAPRVLARVACIPAVQYSRAAHASKSKPLQMHAGCEIPQWSEARFLVCAAKPAAVTSTVSRHNALRIIAGVCCSARLCSIAFDRLPPVLKMECRETLASSSQQATVSGIWHLPLPCVASFTCSSTIRLASFVGPLCLPMV